MDFNLARHNMVEHQIRPNRVNDAHIVDAMADLPRERFVPESAAGIAYSDKEIFLGEDRYLMAPMLLANLLQEARITRDHIVLNIGCGSGYSTAVLAKISRAVIGIEVSSLLADKASTLMVDLGIDNALIVENRLVDGYAKQAPYDVIVFDGAIEQVPKKIIGQLVDGGRIVSVIGDPSTLGISMDRVVVMSKYGDLISNSAKFEATTPYLLDFNKEKTFEF